MTADEEPADRPGPWPVVGTRRHYDGDWVVGLREDDVHRPGHPDEVFGRLVLEHPGAVVVLAVDDEERVCCLRQYRHASQGLMVELPAGIRDEEGEDPVDTAARELLEEAELRAEEWRLLAHAWPSAGITSERHLVYLARGLSRADRGDFEPHAEEAEIEVFWTPVDDLLEAVLDGRVQEGPLMIAALTYDALRRRGRL
ncbi:MAG: NUDIX hydrolase [Marmoricola sp.]|nr:NUDIX hydrolase [Marmoricola sp.]